MNVLYGETKITIENLFAEKMKNAETMEEKIKYMNVFDNWNSFFKRITA